jgi:hypothetical protein
MLEFKSLADVDACQFDDPCVGRAVRDAVAMLVDAVSCPEHPYDPDADGWVVLLEPGDGDDALDAFASGGLPELCYEGAIQDEASGCILTALCTNNSWGLTILVPSDGEFLSPAARRRLLEELP